MKTLLADGDTRWINRGAYDLLGDDSERDRSPAAGLPRAPALYGSLPEQLKRPDSFACAAEEDAARSAREYRINESEQVDVPAVKARGLVVMVHRLPAGKGIQVTAINFGRTAVQETVTIKTAPPGGVGHRSPRREGARQAGRRRAAAARPRSSRGASPAYQVVSQRGAAMGVEKPPLSFWQIWNMSFGFLGIQFGWALQMANMSAIYEYLGADAHQIPILWLAAPLTGLLVQPIIGHMSDRTWNRLGRRRPYFLVGALLASFALIAMPNSSALWMAAGLLWVLDASINISMEPFRAFVADLLPAEQRTRGFAMQALFIGLGAVIASMLPWLLSDVFPVGGDGGRRHGHPARGDAAPSTSARSSSWPPCSGPSSRPGSTRPRTWRRSSRMKAEKAGIVAGAAEIFHDVLAMPPDHAAPGLGADLHLARPLLHVAVLRRGGGPEHLRRHARHPRLRAGHRVGRQLLRDVLGRLLRLLVRAAGGGRAAGPQAHPRRCACSRAPSA